MALKLEQDFYGLSLPATAKVYDLRVKRVDISADGTNISSHRYDAEIDVKFFSQKTGEHIKNEDKTLKIEGITQELVEQVLPAIYGIAQSEIGGETDEPFTE